MTYHPSSRVLRRAVPLLLSTSLLLGGCASRSLVAPPPVVDWSAGALPAAPVPAASAQLYTVRREDTLASIARRFKTTPVELASWNGLGSNPRIRIDQVLRVTSPALASPDVNASVATTQPIGTESVEQRPLGTEAGRVIAPGSSTSASNAPIKVGPIGVKRPYSEATLAELSKPDGDVPTGRSPAVTPAMEAAAGSSVSLPPPGITWSWPAAGKPIASFADGKTKGLDMPGKAGDAVLAAADGKVTFAGTGVRGYGNFLIIRHSPDLLSVYAHNRVNLVKEGAVVTKGQKIAEMGASDADAVRLHFEIRNDSKPVDPMKYLPER